MDEEAIKIQLTKEVVCQFSRSSGPGGQNINKVNTKVTLTWAYAQADWLSMDVKERIGRILKNRINNDGLIVIQSQKSRNQARNIEDCIEKLAALLFPLTQREKVRRATKPTRGAKERRLREKKVNSDKKQGRNRIDYH